MKKALACTLSLALLLSLTACNKPQAEQPDNSQPDPATTSAKTDTTTLEPEDKATVEQLSTEADNTENENTTPETDDTQDESTAPETDDTQDESTTNVNPPSTNTNTQQSSQTQSQTSTSSSSSSSAQQKSGGSSLDEQNKSNLEAMHEAGLGSAMFGPPPTEEEKQRDFENQTSLGRTPIYEDGKITGWASDDAQ